MKQTKGRQTRDGAEVRRVQVMLDEETIDRAKVLGGGNLSQGIRAAAAKAKAQVSASHIKRLRRLLDDFQREERELCERFGNEVVPQSMRARRIKDAEAIDAILSFIA